METCLHLRRDINRVSYTDSERYFAYLLPKLHRTKLARDSWNHPLFHTQRTKNKLISRNPHRFVLYNQTETNARKHNFGKKKEI